MKLFQAIGASIALHIGLVLSLMALGYEFVFLKKERVEWITLEPPAEMKGDERIRVKKQQRTKETSLHSTDMISRKDLLPDPTPRPLMDGQRGKKIKTTVGSPNDIFMKSGTDQVSPAVRERLKAMLPAELEIGDFSAINIDQNMYFGFSRRMAEKVGWLWVQNVMSSFEKMKLKGEFGPTPKAWTTIVEVILDKNGTVVSTQPLQLSGDWDMDNSPMRAFKQAKHFPNPPEDLIEEDGYIRINYRFIVYYNPN